MLHVYFPCVVQTYLEFYAYSYSGILIFLDVFFKLMYNFNQC